MSPKRNEDKIMSVLNAWSEMRPEKSFAGMTLEQFKAVIAPSVDARAAIVAAREAIQSASIERDNSDRASVDAALRVVAAVIADHEEGADGALYSKMGYIRRRDRASGLTRRKGKASDTARPDDIAA